MQTVVAGTDEMSRQSQGVLVAIDWESIRRGAQMYQRTVTPAELCRAVRDVGGIFGEVAGGKAFGDWTVWADDGREFTEAGMVLYRAPRTGAGKDRTDPAVLLEVYEWIRDRGGLRHGDPGLGGRRLPGPGGPGADVHGKRIVLCAFSQSVSRDLLATAPLVSAGGGTGHSTWRSTAM